MAGMSWEPFELDGMNGAWVRPHRGHDRRRAILYCHGGGYTSGNLGYSRILASKLALTSPAGRCFLRVPPAPLSTPIPPR